MNSDSTKVKGPRSLLLLAVVLGCSGMAIAQTGQGSSAKKLPSVIAKAVETVPFSFVYAGKPSSELLPGWEQKQVEANPARRPGAPRVDLSRSPYRFGNHR